MKKSILVLIVTIILASSVFALPLTALIFQKSVKLATILTVDPDNY